MIKSFAGKGLKRFAEKGDPSKLSVQNHLRVALILAQLDAATAPEDMNSAGLFFHQLTGAKAGTYSVRVTGNWRITFKFDGEDAVDVDLEDYH
jgi:proteic killer suppression protein